MKSLRYENSHLTCPYLTAWLQLSNDHTLLSFLIIEHQHCWRVNWASVLKSVQCARLQHFKVQEFVLCSDQRWKVRQQISLDGQPGGARSSSNCPQPPVFRLATCLHSPEDMWMWIVDKYLLNFPQIPVFNIFQASHQSIYTWRHVDKYLSNCLVSTSTCLRLFQANHLSTYAWRHVNVDTFSSVRHVLVRV